MFEKSGELTTIPFIQLDQMKMEFLKALADNAASGLGKEIKIDLNKTFINITGK